MSRTREQIVQMRLFLPKTVDPSRLSEAGSREARYLLAELLAAIAKTKEAERELIGEPHDQDHRISS